MNNPNLDLGGGLDANYNPLHPPHARAAEARRSAR